MQQPLEEEALPADATSALFMSGLPLDMAKREMAHILRPFEGFQVCTFFACHLTYSCMGSPAAHALCAHLICTFRL